METDCREMLRRAVLERCFRFIARRCAPKSNLLGATVGLKLAPVKAFLTMYTGG